MAPMGLAFKQLVPSVALRPFRNITGIIYDSSTDYMWVADLGAPNGPPQFPVFNATTRKLHGIVDLSPAWTIPPNSYNGPSAICTDGTYFYVCQYSGSKTAIIDKNTLHVVGVFDGYGAISSNSIAAAGGKFYMAVDQTGFAVGTSINTVSFITANAISAFPLSVGPNASNHGTVLWNGFFGPSPNAYNARTIGVNPNTSNLWLGTFNPVTISSPSADQQKIILLDYNMNYISDTTFTMNYPGSSYYALFYAFAFCGGSFGNAMISAIHQSNPNSPYNTLDGATAQVFSNFSPFITLPTSAPYNHGIAADYCFYDSYNDTLFIVLGSNPALLRYNSSGTLLSTVGNPTAAEYPFIWSSIGPNNIWTSFYNFSPSFTPYIKVFSSGVGTETLVDTLYGY